MERPEPQPEQALAVPQARGSGVAGELRLGELSSDQRQVLCEWVIATEGGSDRAQWCQEPCVNGACSEAYRAQPWTVSQCFGFLDRAGGCAATVRDLERCAFRMAPDLCASPGEECAAVEGC